MHAFWLVTLVLSMGIGLLSLRLGMILYLIGALIFPSLWFGEVALRFEIVYCLWLVFVLFLRKAISASTFRWHPVLSRYGLFLVAVILSTIFALLSTQGSLTQLLISFYGIFRPLLVMFLFLNVPVDEKFARRILWVFVWLSIPIALLSIGQTLGLSIAQEITLRGYTSPWRTPVFRLLEEQGVIVRSTGVFESPVFNATYFLMVLITAGFLLVRGGHKPFHKWVLYLSFGLALVAGITTLSSAFLLGLLFALSLFVVFLWPRYQRRFLRIAIGSACVTGLLIVSFLPYLSQQPFFLGTLRYQFQRILSGSVLETRYNPEAGILANTYQAIAQRPIFGWGLSQLEDVFVGDSLYISTLYRGGIFGLLLFLWVVWRILRHTWRYSRAVGIYGEVNMLSLLWTLIGLVVAVGSGGTFLTLRLQEWYWAVVGLSLNTYLLQTQPASIGLIGWIGKSSHGESKR